MYLWLPSRFVKSQVLSVSTNHPGLQDEGSKLALRAARKAYSLESLTRGTLQLLRVAVRRLKAHKQRVPIMEQMSHKD